MVSQELTEHRRRVAESKVEMRIRLADGAAWADTVERCSVLPELLDMLTLRARRSLGEVMENVALFRRWKAGEFVPLDLDKRVIAINLAAHLEQSERIARRDGIDEPPEPVQVLDRGAW